MNIKNARRGLIVASTICGLGIAAPAVADCLTVGQSQFEFFGKSGVLVTFVSGDVQHFVMRQPGHSGHSGVVWAGQPFAGLTIQKPRQTSAVDVSVQVSSGDDHCAIRLERY